MLLRKAEFIRKDKRGKLIQISSALWKQANYLEIKKNNSFGGHYHKHKKELFYIIDGFVKVEIINIKNKQGTRLNFVKEDIFIILPYEKHTIIALKHSKLIELLSEKYSKEDTYE